MKGLYVTLGWTWTNFSDSRQNVDSARVPRVARQYSSGLMTNFAEVHAFTGVEHKRLFVKNQYNIFTTRLQRRNTWKKRIGEEVGGVGRGILHHNKLKIDSWQKNEEETEPGEKLLKRKNNETEFSDKWAKYANSSFSRVTFTFCWKMSRVAFWKISQRQVQTSSSPFSSGQSGPFWPTYTIFYFQVMIWLPNTSIRKIMIIYHWFWFYRM